MNTEKKKIHLIYLLATVFALIMITDLRMPTSVFAQTASSQLTVNAQDSNGNKITGLYTVLEQHGNVLSAGFTPATFTLIDGQTYTVHVSDYGKYVFDHWADTGSTNPSRDISISSNSQITAIYKIISQLTVNAQDSKGNSLSGFYTVLLQNGNQIGSGFTPATFTLIDGQTYTVHVDDYGKYMFSYWADTGSTNPSRDISISSDTQITAVYKTVPQPPTNLSASATSSSEVDLIWKAPSDDGGSSITGYKIERSTDGGSTWSTIISNTASTATTYSDTGLSPNTTYTYRVSAINDVGISDPSNTASATTPLVSVGISVGPVVTGKVSVGPVNVPTPP